jgi:hypothetical protein
MCSSVPLCILHTFLHRSIFTIHAKAWALLNISTHSAITQNASAHENNRTEATPNQSEPRMSLETIISVGVFGWLAIGMVLMGLGIW